MSHKLKNISFLCRGCNYATNSTREIKQHAAKCTGPTKAFEDPFTELDHYKAFLKAKTSFVFTPVKTLMDRLKEAPSNKIVTFLRSLQRKRSSYLLVNTMADYKGRVEADFKAIAGVLKHRGDVEQHMTETYAMSGLDCRLMGKRSKALCADDIQLLRYAYLKPMGPIFDYSSLLTNCMDYRLCILPVSKVIKRGLLSCGGSIVHRKGSLFYTAESVGEWRLDGSLDALTRKLIVNLSQYMVTLFKRFYREDMGSNDFDQEHIDKMGVECQQLLSNLKVLNNYIKINIFIRNVVTKFFPNKKGVFNLSIADQRPKIVKGVNREALRVLFGKVTDADLACL